MTPRQARPTAVPKEAATKPLLPGSVNILMVDDHRENLLALEGILRQPEYNLVSANSGREALKHLLDGDFALILLDVKMPDMDGFETAELIRNREQSRHTPIIFLTAIDQLPGSETRGYAAGAVDFLFKPFNPDVLRSKVRAFVDLFVKGRELQERAEQLRQKELEEHRRTLEEVQVQRDRFFSLAYDMMAVFDQDGVIREANHAWEKCLGVSVEKLQGTPLVDLFQEQDRPLLLGALRGLQEGRGFATLEACHRTQEKDLRWLSWTLLTFPNEAGGYVVARDVTDRVRTGRQLEDFFENAPIGSHWIGPDGTILRANRAEVDLLGYPLTELIGRSMNEFHSDAQAAEDLLARLKTGETIREFSGRLRCRDGSLKDVLIDANALIEEGRFIHSRGFLRDVTDQRQAERRQEAIYAVTAILAEARNFIDAAPRLLESIAKMLGWDVGAAWKIDDAMQSMKCISTWESEATPSPIFLEATRRSDLRRGMGLPGIVWESGCVLWCPKLSDEPRFSRREEAKKDGLQQGIVMPLLMGDDVLGVLEFFGRGLRQPEEALVSLVAALGSQIGQFIERKRTENALAERSTRMIRYQAALLEMSAADGEDPEASLRKVTEITCGTLRLARAGLWFFDAPRKQLVCRDQYSSASDLHEQGQRLDVSAISKYLVAVEASRVLAVEQACTDGRTSELAASTYQPDGITSILDAPIRHRGQIVGVLRLGHRGHPRIWSPEEQDFVSSVSDRLSLFLSEIDRHRAQEEIRRLNAGLEARVTERTGQLTEALQEQEQFAYSVSHDLRAPLRAMSGFSQALFEDYSGVLDDTGREYARRIMDASERMDALIKDLLAYSRLSRADIPLEKVEPAKLVSEVLQQLEIERTERKGKVEVVEPLLPVRGNALALTQVILNLISNAFKFVAKDVVPTLRIRTELRGTKVRLWFEDNGIGILPEHQDRIFRIFERLNRAEQYPGTGIGLAMVRKALSRMDGNSGVESDGRTGSRFWIELEKA